MDHVKETLKQYGQEHLLDFWEEINDEQRKELIHDISCIDFAHIDHLKRMYIEKSQPSMQDSSEQIIEPLPSGVRASKQETSEEILVQYQKLTLDALSQNKVAALLLAGGQGTRLGFPHPKGMLDVGLDSHKTLFQLQAERILKLESLADSKMQNPNKDSKIVWYIMTSETTCTDTKTFLEKNSHFGLSPNQVVIFEQKTLPCFCRHSHKILLDQKHRIARAPDGNGGVYSVLKELQILEDMDKRGIEFLHVYCVDNILVRVCDPHFLGYCISRHADVGAKVVRKTVPNESVGVICQVLNPKTGHHPSFKVIEYSELSKELSEQRNEIDGQLVYNAGNICDHFFTRKFLEIMSNQQLRHHLAFKKIAHINHENGKRINPNAPNGIKLEKFIFDSFEYVQGARFAVWEVNRSTEFSPIKNADAPGAVNCPSTARQALLEAQKIDDTGLL